MFPMKAFFLLAAVVVGTFSGCASTTVSRYAIPHAPGNRAALDHIVASLAEREAFRRVSVNVPALLSLDPAVYVRYRNRFNPDVTIAQFNYPDHLETQLSENGFFGLHPTVEFLQLDAELRRDLQAQFGGSVMFKQEYVPPFKSYLPGR